MKDSLLETLCNDSTLHIFNKFQLNHHHHHDSNTSSTNLYYLNNCFQQAFLITPLYLFLLIHFSYRLGYLSFVIATNQTSLKNKFWSNLNLTLLSNIFLIQLLTLIIISTALLNKLTISLKIVAISVYILLVYHYPHVPLHPNSRTVRKALIVIILISLLECWTAYFVHQPDRLSFILSTISCSLWIFHCLVVFWRSKLSPDDDLEDRRALLIDHENNVILECDESYSFPAKLFFTWVSPLLSKGIHAGIDSSQDLFQLPNSLSSHLLAQSVASYLNVRQTRTGSYRLICFIFSKIYLKLLLLGLLKFVADALTISFPIFLNHLLTYLEQDTSHGDGNQGFMWASLLLASTLISSIFNSYFNFQMSKISLQVRTILINLLYNKLLLVRSTVLVNDFGTGQILNLANTDIERVINLVPSLFQFISLPIQLIITLYLFYTEVKFVFISAVIFIVLLIPINKIICDKITMFSQQLMFWKDKRIEMINEILKGIYTIKTHAWETLFSEKVQAFRKQEVKYLKYRKYLDALCVYFWATTPVIISSLVFGCYVWLNGAHSLTSSKVFTTLALLSMLIMPLNALPWVLNGLMEALVSLKRLNQFYMLTQIDSNHEDLDCEEEIIFDLNNCSFIYNDLDQFQNGQFKLSNIALSTRKKTLVGLIGKVGSGKSSLVKSLLNELIKINGTLTMNQTCKRGIGYVPQEPWIQDATIRENILFGKEYEPHFYNQIIDACELLPDFQLLPQGDGTLAGNHGATLSGGQKTRIALARALYQNFDVYLIDEPFASLDLKVAQSIHRKVFKDILIKKSVILVTNHVEYLHDASTVLLLEHGKITKTIHRTADHFSENLAEQQATNIDQEQDSDDQNDAGGQNTQTFFEENQDQQEEREHGTIKFDVYSAYVSSIGYCTFTMIILLICLMQITRSGSDFWLSLWTKDKDSSNTLVYLYVFISIGILNSIITLMRAFIFAYGGVKAAIRIHDQLLECIFNSSLLFFDLISFGIIINRFSSDTFNVDDALPFTLNIFLAQLSSLLISLVITIYGMPWIILIFIMLTIPYYLIQEYFRSTSRELKRIAATALSPIYAQLDDTICGLTVIRSFAQVERFKNQFNDNVNIYNRIQYSIAAVQQWLNLRLQIFGAIITSFVAFTAVILHNHQYQSVNSSFVGLSLVYSLSLTSLLNGSVQAFTQTELDLISVERIKTLIRKLTEFFEIDNIQTCLDIDYITDDWPNEGVICFNNVSMRYRDNLDYALKNISFKINSGENVAIVGRTGSGKSSIFRALFKLVNIDQGSIIIDGLDIEKISRKILRSRLHIIPQDAFLFNGTIRENLDPLNQYRDDEIWTALFQCKINILVDTLGGLYSLLNESGNQLSIGQKHLLCLARAVLNRSKILCMDEITANIDNETAEVLEELIRTVFKETTILHIAHKIDAVRNYDRIIQMNDGSIVNIFQSIEQYVSENVE